MRRVFMSVPFLCACAAPPSTPDGGSLPPVTVEPLANNVWMHTSYRDIEPYGPIPTHGLVVEVEGRRILIDTAWTVAQTEEILTWSSPAITAAVLTHAHADKMGGVPALHAAGIETFAHPLSNDDAPTRGLAPARHELNFENGAAVLASGAVEVFYPGAGHTRDNIVVYLPTSNILFGGCLVRPGAATGLGNTADGDIEHWDDAVAAVRDRFPDARVVVPSHGDPGGRELLRHTIELATQAQQRD